jgi:hypothetical protein
MRAQARRCYRMSALTWTSSRTCSSLQTIPISSRVSRTRLRAYTTPRRSPFSRHSRLRRRSTALPLHRTYLCAFSFSLGFIESNLNWRCEGSSGGWARGNKRHADIATTGQIRSPFLASHFRRRGRPSQGPLCPWNTYVDATCSLRSPRLILEKKSIAVHPAGTGYASGGEDGFVPVHSFDESYIKARPYGETEILN